MMNLVRLHMISSKSTLKRAYQSQFDGARQLSPIKAPTFLLHQQDLQLSSGLLALILSYLIAWWIQM